MRAPAVPLELEDGGGVTAWLELPTCDRQRHGRDCPAWCFGRAQHYSDRATVWLRDYLDEDDADEWRSLTMPQRAALVMLRREYVRSGRALRGDTVALSRRLGVRITSATLEALNHAGYIRLSASRPLAPGYHAASAEEKREENPSPTPPQPPPRRRRQPPEELICPYPNCGVIFTTQAERHSHVSSWHPELLNDQDGDT